MLLFIDGFDHYGNGGDPVVMGKWGGFEVFAATASTTRFRTGTQSLRIGTSNADLFTKTLPASGGAVTGFAVYADSAWSPTRNLCEVSEGAVVHMAIHIEASGLVVVKRGTTVLATGTTVIPFGGWVFIEFKCIIDAVNGSYELRIDGTTEAALTNVGPVNTRNGGATGQWNNIHFRSAASGNISYVDDFYVCDTSGPAPRNDFLGTIKVETLMAQPGNGSNVGMTPSTGTDHGALVDEVPPNSTDYNSSGVVGTKDTYNLANPTLTGDVFGVQINLYAAKSDAGTRKVRPVIRHGGADYDGTEDKAILTTFKYVSEIFSTKPGGGEWAVADVSALEAGMKVTV